MDEWFLSRRDSTIVARRFIAGLAIHMIRVPEGRCDRSLARSAWESATQKSRPVGYGVIRAGVRTDSMIGPTKFRMQKPKKICRMTSCLLGLAEPRPIIPYPTGRLLRGTMSQALRAWLRSTVPPGQEPFALKGRQITWAKYTQRYNLRVTYSAPRAEANVR
jgi:hypothetical protein